MKQLESVLDIAAYVVRKALKNFVTKGYITYIKLKPIEVSISESLSGELK